MILLNENKIKIFNCDLNDTNLFNCILNEVGEKDLDSLSSSAPMIQDRTYINCINASLVNCLRNNKEELDFPQVKLQIIKNENEDWLINQINIIVDKQIDDNLLNEKVNQCIKFVKKACRIDESIQLSMIHSEIKEDLKYYKFQLNEVNQLLKAIRDNKSKEDKLFSLFKKISSNEKRSKNL